MSALRASAYPSVLFAMNLPALLTWSRRAGAAHWKRHDRFSRNLHDPRIDPISEVCSMIVTSMILELRPQSVRDR